MMKFAVAHGLFARSATSSAQHGWGDFLRSVRRLPPAIVPGLMVAAVLCVLGPALATALQPAAGPLQVAAPLPAAVVPEPPRSRCPGCGVVEAIRPLPPVGGVPAGFEFTVRLRDGSIRTSTTPSPTSWRVGDRIILIGGDAS